MERLRIYWSELLEESASYRKLAECSLAGNNVIVISHLPASSLCFVAAILARDAKKPLLVVTAGAEKAHDFYHDFDYLGVKRVLHFPKWETLPYEDEGPAVEIASKRLDVYQALSDHICEEKRDGGRTGEIFVTSIEALLQKIVPCEFFNGRSVELKWGDEVDVNDLAERLTRAGYDRLPLVESRGEFSIRGGIIDVYPLNLEYPVRIDLFGCEIESIRCFDVYTQRSLREREALERVILHPANERQMTLDALKEGYKLETLLQQMPKDILIVLDEPERFGEVDAAFKSLVERQYAEARNAGGDAYEPGNLYAGLEDIAGEWGRFQRIEHSLLVRSELPAGATPIDFHASSFDAISPSLDYYLDLIRRRQAEDYFVNIVCDNDGQAMRFEEVLAEHELGAVKILASDAEGKGFIGRRGGGIVQDIVITVGLLHSGFVLPEARILFVTDREIFGRYKRRPIYRKIYKGLPIATADEINRGDYVVHVDHGVGQYLGIRQQVIEGKVVDLIEIVYQDDDKLLVPIEKIKYVQKYSVVEGVVPQIDRLGSKQWSQRKRKTQEAIERMAQELLDLYARRSIAKGYTYSTDTPWQGEFEASFLYQETPDQLRAIEEVKQDMMIEKPMDRLVCGDVGYGKTEVAIRAAFKAVQEGRQVAVLAPTTVLVQQHYTTFRERFAEYPIRLEMLSRFKTEREQRAMLKGIKYGEVNVVIGTHRLLSDDVVFLDLGLVVVDEEQRFGVRHKEKLKKLKTSVDFLTLTATPIPRTLYMALSGIRDMSLITTAPPDRHPIKTRVIHFDEEQIQEGILRELNRGGQVFFVHNRIETIEEMTRRLRAMIPQARFAIAHGQMPERELEQVMLDFVDGRHDVLVSTTIIENGLDIPNVNTIVINRADAFGLAQLYQLRGRVGRDIKQAYAYLIVPRGQAITEAAVRRLAAIEEFTELGVGFQIAMRDMEIRGTGNILGKEQHGCISAIGFDLYCQLLEEAVHKLKGEPVEEELPVEVKCSVDSYIPAEYVPVESQRIAIYKKLSAARRLEDISEIADELKDRYGEAPQPVRMILSVARLRLLARRAGIERIALSESGIECVARDGASRAHDIVKALRQRFPLIQRATWRGENTLQLRFKDWDKHDQLSLAIAVLEELTPTKLM
jgi:transcription-repair coupling factor (superfamily II helicase)